MNKQSKYIMPVYLMFLAHACLCLITCQSPAVSVKQETTVAETDSTTFVEQEGPEFDLSFLTGHFDPASHPDFVLVDTAYADRPGLYLHEATYKAFIKMHKAAMKDGVVLQIRSATRNFSAQKGIWERKWTGETTIENGQNASTAYPDPVTRARMILKYSSMPGSSRHHWGTDIDLNSFDNSWFESGSGLQIFEWLSEHGTAFGFCQPYSAKGSSRPHGYEEERWHWSYMPLSRPLTQMASDSLTDEMISGFMGAETAAQLQIVERYVLGINPECFEKTSQ